MASAMLSYKKEIESQKEQALVLFDTNKVHTPERRMRIKSNKNQLLIYMLTAVLLETVLWTLMDTIARKCHNKAIRTSMMKCRKYCLWSILMLQFSYSKINYNSLNCTLITPYHLNKYCDSVPWYYFGGWCVLFDLLIDFD